MRSPLTLEHLQTAMFDVYNNDQPRTIAILTKSVEFRARLCIERGYQFVGDALEECCRRARMVIDIANDLETESIIQLDFKKMSGMMNKTNKNIWPLSPRFERTNEEAFQLN